MDNMKSSVELYTQIEIERYFNNSLNENDSIVLCLKVLVLFFDTICFEYHIFRIMGMFK